MLRLRGGPVCRQLCGGSEDARWMSGQFPAAQSVGSPEPQLCRRCVCPRGCSGRWGQWALLQVLATSALLFPKPAVRLGTGYRSIYPPSYATGEARSSLAQFWLTCCTFSFLAQEKMRLTVSGCCLPMVNRWLLCGFPEQLLNLSWRDD